MAVVVFDLDGTVCNCDHRIGYIRTKPKNWAAFFAGIKNDPPNDEIVKLLLMYHHNNDVVVLCTGRGEQERQASEEWLAANNVPYAEMFMRPAKDNRPDYMVKSELADQIIAKYGNIEIWFDDRNQVVEAIRAKGIRVLQVAPGDF